MISHPMYVCPLCKSTDTIIIHSVLPADLITAWRDQFKIDITEELAGTKLIRLHECHKCHLRFFTPQSIVGSAQLYKELQKFDWYYMPHKWEHSAALRDISKNSRVLEIGCATGDFVERLRRDYNVDALGIELNQEAVNIAQQLGRPVLGLDLASLSQQQTEGFDVVCSFQVLEHVPDPNEFIKHSLKLLRPRGKLLIGLPNADSFLKYQDNLLDMPPHHMTRWSLKCLKSLSDIFSLQLVSLHKEPLATYHIDGYIQAYSRKIRQLPGGRLIASSYSNRILANIVRSTSLNKYLQGQSIYVGFNLI